MMRTSTPFPTRSASSRSIAGSLTWGRKSQLLLRALDEAGQLITGVLGAHDEPVVTRRERVAGGVGLEELQGFLDQLAFRVTTPKLRLLSMSMPVKLKP